jgi:hypothetical protein
MKEIFVSAVSPVVEQNNKLVVSPWVEKVCGGKLWVGSLC